MVRGKNGVGVRVSTDDWERLGICPGKQVRVKGPGVDGSYLLALATEEPPLVWLRFLCGARPVPVPADGPSRHFSTLQRRATPMPTRHNMSRRQPRKNE